MKILVITAAFTITGVPLAQIRLARALAKRGHEVDLMIGGTYPEYPVPEVPGVKVIIIGRLGVRKLIFPLWTYLRQQRPEVIFSAEDHLNGVVLLSTILSGSDARITGSSRVPPSDTYSNRLGSKGWFNKQLLKAVMWRANVLTCVAEDMVESYRLYFEPTPHKCIHNIVVDEQSRLKMLEPVAHEWLAERREIPVVVAAGTLTERKGFSDLISAFALAREQRDARLIILGDGPLRQELQDQIDALGLTAWIQLLGFVDNPLKYYHRANVIALTSHAEGLPNVLVEGMFCGCTPVATDCPTGPREVLADGKYGYLVTVGDPADICRGLVQAFDHPVPQGLLTEAVARFSEEKVIEAHFASLNLPWTEATGRETFEA